MESRERIACSLFYLYELSKGGLDYLSNKKPLLIRGLFITD
jgi:hypothetical protein